jgi:hypothetical protein
VPAPTINARLSSLRCQVLNVPRLYALGLEDDEIDEDVEELVRYDETINIVVDEFGVGWLGYGSSCQRLFGRDSIDWRHSNQRFERTTV